MARRRRKTHNRKPDIRNQYRINRDILVPEVRLVGDNFDEVSEIVGHKVEPGVFPTRVAQNWARDMGIDLVEISPKAVPPVCRLIEFNKFIYERKRKEKEIKSKTVKTVVKEIRFGPNTDDHDFDFKLRHAIKFLEDGHKVKAYVHFRGRSIVFKERGELLLLRFMQELDDLGSAENLPQMEGRRMHVILAPKKKK
ncbi:MAG: translation initiation factor IF-3 [Bacteroidetes bacterium]|nr:MAG: translation initiation factor IF-3 [Bacteroidota bacterium]